MCACHAVCGVHAFEMQSDDNTQRTNERTHERVPLVGELVGSVGVRRGAASRPAVQSLKGSAYALTVVIRDT